LTGSSSVGYLRGEEGLPQPTDLRSHCLRNHECEEEAAAPGDDSPG
jgi:hypothetical protein